MPTAALKNVPTRGFGIAIFFIGVALLFPALAYATWHSYKALVGWQG